MRDFKGLGPADYLKILWWRKLYFIAIFLLVSGGVGVYAWRLPNVYRSETRILVESALLPQDYVRPADRSTPEEQIAAIRERLQSRSLMERVIQDNNLFGYGSGRTFSMDDAVEALRKSIQVINTSRNTFTISFAASDPEFAQSFTKRLADLLIDSNRSSRKTKAVEADAFLDDQLRQTERDLAEQEQKIKEFKTAHLGELPEQSTANMNAVSGLQAQLTAVDNELQHARDQRKLLDFRAQEQKRLSALARNTVPPSPADTRPREVVAATAALAAKQAELTALNGKYTPQHPDVVRVSKEVEELKQRLAQALTDAQKPGNSSAELTPLGEGDSKPSATKAATPAINSDTMLEIQEAEIKLEAQTLNDDIDKRQKEREQILRQIKTYQERLNQAPAREQELMGLSRDLEVLRQQYGNLQNKRFQAQMTADMEKNKSNETYQVVDEANLPEKPAFPNKIQIALIGIGAGILFGTGAAFGREVVDSTLGSELETEAILQVPVLVTISEIPKKEQRLIGSSNAA